MIRRTSAVAVRKVPTRSAPGAALPAWQKKFAAGLDLGRYKQTVKDEPNYTYVLFLRGTLTLVDRKVVNVYGKNFELPANVAWAASKAALGQFKPPPDREDGMTYWNFAHGYVVTGAKNGKVYQTVKQ